MQTNKKAIQNPLVIIPVIGLVVMLAYEACHYILPGLPQEIVTFLGIVLAATLGNSLRTDRKKRQ